MKQPILRSLMLALKIVALLVVLNVSLVAQLTGDYRTMNSGSWTSAGTWEVYTGAGWIATEVYPSFGTWTTAIRAGHTVSVSEGISVGPLVIQGQLSIAAGTTISSYYDLTVNGTVAGTDSTSRIGLRGSDKHLYLDGAIFSNVTLAITSENTLLVEGTASFTGSKFFVEGSTLKLSDDLSLTGAKLEITYYSTLDVYGNQLSLNGCSVTVSDHGEVVDNNDELGDVVTTGTTTLRLGGDFSADLQVQSGTTTSWSELVTSSKNEKALAKRLGASPSPQQVAATAKPRIPRKTTIGDLAHIYGSIEVTGGTLFVPSGETLKVGDEVTVDHATIGGGDGTFQVDGSNVNFMLDGAVISVANLLIEDDYDHNIEGSGTLTGCRLNIDEGYLHLTDDLTLTGGTIQLTDGLIDPYGNNLILNNTTLNISDSGTLDDYSDGEAGMVVTKGSTTIDNGGNFNIPLQVFSGTTSAWSEVYTPSIAPPALAKKSTPQQQARRLAMAAKSRAHGKIATSGFRRYRGDFDVKSGATLLIPSGKTLELADGVTLQEASGSTTTGEITTTCWFDDTTRVLFEGMGASVHRSGAAPGAIKFTRMTGTAPILSGAVAIKRYFDITPDNNSGLNADLTFSYSTGELNGRTESGLKLFKSTNNGVAWVSQVGTVNTSTHAITLHGITSFSRWTAGQQGSLAPTLTNVASWYGYRGETLTLTLTGTNFESSSSVAFSRAGITVNAVRLLSSTQIEVDIAISATADLGSSSVTVTNSVGSATLNEAFQIQVPDPYLASILPTSAHRGDVVTVTLNGLNFVSGITSADFGSGIAVDSLTVLSPTQIRLRASISLTAALGARDVSVTISAPGGGTATLTAAFSIGNPSPAVSSIAPASGGRGLSIPVTITGASFVPGVTTIGMGSGIAPGPLTFDGPTKITTTVAISRLAALGSRDIVATTPAPGGGNSTLAAAFVVQNPVPTISAVNPVSGLPGQTLNVAVAGTGFFTSVTTLDFGPDVTVNTTAVDTSGTQIQASITVAPAALAGPRTVTVTNAAPGGGSITLLNAFIVNNPVPTLTSISPIAGGIGQTLDVTVVGTNFVKGATTVNFGVGVAVNSFVMNSATSISANITIASDAVAAARSVTVTNAGPGGGKATLSFAFSVQYLAPTISSVSPATGPRGVSSTVTVTGANFSAGSTSIDFGSGLTVSSISVTSPTQLTANLTIPVETALGSHNVVVTNPAPGGGSATLVGGFSVTNPIPTITAISPAILVKGGTADVVATGTLFFSGVTSISFGTNATVSGLVVRSLTELQATISMSSAASVGARDVVVTNAAPGGGSATLAGGFTVTNPVPTLGAVSPASAGRGSLVNVTITGTQFATGVTSVSFGSDISVISTTVKSPSEILVNISIAATATVGSRSVTVTNATPGGGSASLATGFGVTTNPATDIEGSLGMIPDQYVLNEAYPNPFNPSTRIRYGIPEDSRVEIVVHNMLGNVVTQLVVGERSKGLYELRWQADNLPSGVYLIRMQAQSTESAKRFLASRKVVLVK